MAGDEGQSDSAASFASSESKRGSWRERYTSGFTPPPGNFQGRRCSLSRRKFAVHPFRYHQILRRGSGRNSDQDFAHFLQIAYGSLMEVVSQCFIALDENYITEELLVEIADDADLLAGKIVALSKSLGRISRITNLSRVSSDERQETQKPSTNDSSPSTQ